MPAARRATSTRATVNGTTYYYKVSAENANGEGQLSNEASATPADLVPPGAPLPTVDSFDRANENPLSDAGTLDERHQLDGRSRDGPLHDREPRSPARRRRPAPPGATPPSTAPTSRSWARLSTLPGTDNAISACYARVQQPGTLDLRRLHAAHEPARGNRPGLHRSHRQRRRRQPADGQPGARGRRRPTAAREGLDSSRPGATTARPGHGSASSTTPPTRAAGFTGVGIRGTTGRVDDFGARTIGAPPPDTEPPSAPGTLSATATSASQIDLSWGAATDNVAVTLYRIDRCQGAGCSNFAEIATTSSTSYPNSGLSASTSYSYRVRAQDAVPNLGPYSNTASATTLTPPDTEAPSAPGT